jgi:signal transduction histidine kinase
MGPLSSAGGNVPGTSPAPRIAWPGLLVDWVFSLVVAGCRRRGVRVVATVILAVAAVASSYANHPTLDFRVAVPLALLATAPLAVAGRFPAVSLGVVLAANTGFLLFARLSWPAEGVAAWLIALGVCPVLLPRALAVMAVTATEAAVLAGVFVPSSVTGSPADSSAILAAAAAVLVAWGTGEVVRARRLSAAERAAAAQQVRALTEHGAATRERVAIARELHDVVAHHISMIAVRAATVPYEVEDLPPPAQAAFREIAEEARTALTELRTVLGVLRAPDAGITDRPLPRLGDLAELAERMRGAGLDVALRTEGAPRSLPESVELCGYRFVQEALTNAGRHSPGSQAEVHLAYQLDALQITVRDDGAPRTAAGRKRRDAVCQPGFGLVGMRERVTALGGQFAAGPDQAGGFVVTARLPIPPLEPAAAHG